MKKKLNLREYWDHVGTENVAKIIEAVGSSRQHFRAMRYGLKKPGIKRALMIVAAAEEFTPGWSPDLELLLAGVPLGSKTDHRTIGGSPEFNASRIEKSPEFAASSRGRKT